MLALAAPKRASFAPNGRLCECSSSRRVHEGTALAGHSPKSASLELVATARRFSHCTQVQSCRSHCPCIFAWAFNFSRRFPRSTKLSTTCTPRLCVDA